MVRVFFLLAKQRTYSIVPYFFSVFLWQKYNYAMINGSDKGNKFLIKFEWKHQIKIVCCRWKNHIEGENALRNGKTKQKITFPCWIFYRFENSLFHSYWPTLIFAVIWTQQIFFQFSFENSLFTLSQMITLRYQNKKYSNQLNIIIMYF